MENNMGSIFILAAGIVVLVVGALKRKAEWVLNVVMRGILGTLAICFINEGLVMLGISLGIGVNAVTVLTCAILGIPGLLALYGIAIYRML